MWLQVINKVKERYIKPPRNVNVTLNDTVFTCTDKLCETKLSVWMYYPAFTQKINYMINDFHCSDWSDRLSLIVFTKYWL